VADSHHNEDPGWFSWRSLLTIFVPWVGLQQAQKDGANALEMLRQLFTAFTSALLLIGVVVLFLASGNSSERAMSPGVVAAGVAGYGVVSLFISRLVERPLDCSDTGALLVSYRTRFFLRIAFAEAAALVGFVGFFGSPVTSVGHERPGRGGQWPPRSSRQRAMRLSVERNP
jgi:F0F1-type ATP synthase membrane subunit c/vacuolar-type H+-ATPase subunit K